MAIIERIQAAPGETTLDLLGQDMDTIVGEFNKGIDPSSIPNGKITSEKLSLSNSGSGNTGFWVGTSSIPAGAIGGLNFKVSTNNLGLGVANGFLYQVTPYIDIFMDPIGSGGLYIPNIYSGNSPAAGGNTGFDKFMLTSYLQASSNGLLPYMFHYEMKVRNNDSVAHNFYAVVNFSILNSTATRSN